MKWPIRNLLNPVSTRTLLYGTDPFDTEYVLQKIDQIKVMSGKQIKEVWFSEWERKAARYIEYAKKAEEKGKYLPDAQARPSPSRRSSPSPRQ